MANEIVKYHNDMASVSFPGFTVADHDLFTALIYECKGKGTERHPIPYDVLKDLSGFSSKDDKRFIRYLDDFTDKLMNLQYRSYESNGGFEKFHLFEGFKNDPKNRVFWVGTTSSFAYILNNEIDDLTEDVIPLLRAGYTTYELRQKIALRSVYSKIAFSQLKRFKRTGWWYVSIEEFRRLMNVPEKYRMPDVRRRVLGPIMDELPKYFEDLKLETETGGSSGKKVISLKFTFKPQLERSVWHDDDNKGELRDEYRCPFCGESLFAIIKDNGDVFYGHIDGWKADAPCRRTFGSLEEILEKNGTMKAGDIKGSIYKESHDMEKPSPEKAGFSCRECGRPLYRLYNEKGEMFYGHIDGWSKDAPCRKTYSSIAEIRGLSETPQRSDQDIRDLYERDSSEESRPRDLYSVFETISNDLKKEYER